MEKQELICICGHSVSFHDINAWEQEHYRKYVRDYHIIGACYKQVINSQMRGDLCKCNNFKPDNLKYLEMKYEQSL